MEPGCPGANGGLSAAPERLPAIHLTVAQLTDQLVNGITLGMLYILVALGLNIILGLMGVINFSHGAFFALGAYMTFQLSSTFGLFPAIVAAALMMALLGMFMESVFIRRLYKRPPEHGLMFTVGAFLVFTALIR